MTQKNRGFTLVELAIVLVVLGLIAGGIMAGQSLVRSSEIRSFMADATRYIEAVQTFRTTYDSLPGDMPDATDHWGAVDGATATCVTGEGDGKETCNGNGDGWIARASSTFYEGYRAWQHLANAGLMDGGLSYVASAVDDEHAVICTNVPASKVKGVGYSFALMTDNGLPVHALWLGAQTDDEATNASALTSQEALGIDRKMDDGRANTGNVRGLPGEGSWNANCLNDDDDYALAEAATVGAGGKVCAMRFLMGF